VVAAVVLEQQVLGHDVLLGSGAITVAALHNLGRNPERLFDIWYGSLRLDLDGQPQALADVTRSTRHE
jgi:hypothetical protein